MDHLLLFISKQESVLSIYVRKAKPELSDTVVVFCAVAEKTVCGKEELLNFKKPTK